MGVSRKSKTTQVRLVAQSAEKCVIQFVYAESDFCQRDDAVKDVLGQLQ